MTYFTFVRLDRKEELAFEKEERGSVCLASLAGELGTGALMEQEGDHPLKKATTETSRLCGNEFI